MRAYLAPWPALVVGVTLTIGPIQAGVPFYALVGIAFVLLGVAYLRLARAWVALEATELTFRNLLAPHRIPYAEIDEVERVRPAGVFVHTTDGRRIRLPATVTRARVNELDRVERLVTELTERVDNA